MEPSGPEPADASSIVGRTEPHPRRLALWAAAIAFLLVMVLTHQPRAAAIDALVVPDGVEYAVAAQRLATTGQYDISVVGVTHPSRYPPAFACLLLPAYLLRPDDLLAGVWVCRGLWAAGCAAFAYASARRFGVSIALCVVTLLNLHPTVVANASTILSDMPSLAALLAIVAIRMRGRDLTLTAYAAAGVALAVGVASRSVAAAFALPLLLELWRARHRWRAAGLLLGPAAGAAVGNLIYNRATFGSFAMNGYVYWCAVPYARLDYVFSLDYAARQFPALIGDPGVALPAAVMLVTLSVLYVGDRSSWRDVMLPMLLATLPVAALYLFYFYGQQRLFLPLIVCSMACGGLGLMIWLHRRPVGCWIARLACSGLVVFALDRSASVAADAHPVHDLLTSLRASLPDRCRLITALDPVLVEAAVTRGTQREWIAVDRTQEYADKVVIDHRPSLAGIPRPPPFVHIWPQLLAQGARLAVPQTAADDALLDRLADPSGPPVFTDLLTLSRSPALRERLGRRFVARQVSDAPGVIECVPRPAAITSTAPRP